jgi:4-diphosphocytidyl-2-C-methyl-D-erythritol kinase
METKPQYSSTENSLRVRAPAKINLSLLIAGRRPDGFHEIETLMAKVNLYDEILIEPGSRPGIELQCQGPHWAPQGPDNLVYRAARLLLDTCQAKAHLKITLTKNVPAGSGLGSASSDAAATLMGVAHHLRLDLPGGQLTQLAGQLGSDVAFFLGGPLALCAGRGEKVTPLALSYDFLALLILPGVNVSTAKIYAHYIHDADLYQRQHKRITAYLAKKRIDSVVKMRTNMLARTCFSLEGKLAELKNQIEALDIGPLCLTGSGSAMFEIIHSGDVSEVECQQKILARQIDCPSLIVTNNPW